jgi:hypothetical protein
MAQTIEDASDRPVIFGDFTRILHVNTVREMAGKEVKSPSTWLRELVAYFSLPMKAHNNFLATLST